MANSTRRFETGDAVVYRGKTWQVCRLTRYDEHKHLCYKVRRGSARKFVRGDRIQFAD